MRIHVTSRHARTSASVRRFLEERLSRVERFAPVTDAHVVFDVQKSRHVAEILVHVRGREILAREESHDLKTSIDAAVERIERQVKRLKDRQKTQRLKDGTRPNGDELVGAVRSAARATLPRGRAAKAARAAGGGVALEDPGAATRPRIIPARGLPGRPVTIEEAADELLSNGAEFLAFVNTVTDQLNVLYRRKDGDLGLIAPRPAARRARA
jgi:putative sigma-54 modulation protein